MVLRPRPQVSGYFLICNFSSSWRIRLPSTYTHLYECRLSVFGVLHSDYFDLISESADWMSIVHQFLSDIRITPSSNTLSLRPQFSSQFNKHKRKKWKQLTYSKKSLRDSFVFRCGNWDVEKQMNRLLWALIQRTAQFLPKPCTYQSSQIPPPDWLRMLPPNWL